jgi:hypothetical protein
MKKFEMQRFLAPISSRMRVVPVNGNADRTLYITHGHCHPASKLFFNATAEIDLADFVI